MEKETPEPGKTPDSSGRSGDDAPPSEDLRPDWRLTPPSEKRVIRRGAEIELPHVPPTETPTRPESRKKDAPRIRYGYRVEIPKDMTKRPSDQPRIAHRMAFYFIRLLGRRERTDDRMDRSAWLMGGGAGVLFFILSWLPWFRVSWKPGTGEGGGGSVSLRFFDLGPTAYIVAILALVLACIAILCFLHRWPRLPMDAGALIGLCSLVSLGLLLLILIGNVGIVSGAGSRSGLGSDFITGMFITKNSQAPTYIGVLCIIAAVTASLMRLAERKSMKGTVEA